MGADFDGLAEKFEAFTGVWDGADGGRFSAWLAERLGTGGRAVDLGCGTGRHLGLLAERYGSVLAVDPSGDMLARARTGNAGRANVDYLQGGVFDVEGPFDAVLSVAALHHAGDAGTVLPFVRGLLAPGGRLVVVDLVDPGGWADRAWHLDRAFRDSRAAYDLTGDVEQAVAILRQLLDPEWLAVELKDIPLGREEFHRAYAEAFPGAELDDGLNPLMAGVAWTAPGS